MSTFTEQITIDQDAKNVWNLLADIGSIHTWNPGVKNSYYTSVQKDGAGATRRCELNGNNYLEEEVVRWEPTQKLTMRITESTLPFKSADIHFELMPDNGKTVVTLQPVYELKYGFLGKIMDVLFVQNTYRKGMRKLLDGLKEKAERSMDAY